MNYAEKAREILDIWKMSPLSDSDQRMFFRRINEALKQVEDETIESCAKVAEEHTSWSPAQADEVAKAIRALKTKGEEKA